VHADDHAERVERLREIEAEMTPVSRPQLCGERICRDLERGEAGCEHEQGAEDRPKITRARARDN
jgi:hypothetical protein